MFKLRFCNKAELRFTDSRAESKQLGAGRSQDCFSFLVSAIVSPVGYGQGPQTLSLLKPFVWVETTLPLQFSGESVRNHSATYSKTLPLKLERFLCQSQSLQELITIKHGWRCFRQESGSTEKFSISGQLGRTRCSVFLRTD